MKFPLRLALGVLVPAFLHAAPPAKEITDEDVISYLRVKAAVESKNALEKEATLARITKVQDNLPEKPSKPALEIADMYAAHGYVELVPQLSKLRIRRTFADLLSLEGGDLGDVAGAQGKLLKDSKGALFSYTEDHEKGEETWTTQATVLFPFVFKTGTMSEGASLQVFGIMPSIALNRFTSNRVPRDAADLARIKASETDELVGRLGFFGQFDLTDNLFAVVRTNARWKTDTGTASREPGIELEFEPLWQSDRFPALGFGFWAIPHWAKKRPAFNENDPTTYKHVWLAYQARLRARVFWGSVEDDGTGKSGPEYARAGLTAELNFKPFVFEQLTASIAFSELPAISGDVDHEKYLEASIGYILFDDPKENRSVSFEFKYMWGAQDNPGQKMQDQLTAALNVMF